MSSPTRLPRRYWGHLFCIVLLLALLFGLIVLTILLTRGRDIDQFRRTEWMIFAAFLFSAAVIVTGAFAIAVSAGRVLTEHRRQQFLTHLYEGVNTADYTCILPEMEDDRRVLIRRTAEGFLLTIEQHDGQRWQREEDSLVHLPDFAAIPAYLEDHDFCCDPEGLPSIYE